MLSITEKGKSHAGYYLGKGLKARLASKGMPLRKPMVMPSLEQLQYVILSELLGQNEGAKDDNPLDLLQLQQGGCSGQSTWLACRKSQVRPAKCSSLVWNMI